MPRPERRLPEPRAMIVAPQPEAVEAGVAILDAGGNALDAVLACALTQGVVDPMMCGIGGLGVLQILDPATGDHLVLDGLSTCPAACTEGDVGGGFEGECPDGYGYVLRGHVNELGHAAVTTPGILRVFAEAHRRWGRRDWAGLFEPAIAMAERGLAGPPARGDDVRPGRARLRPPELPRQARLHRGRRAALPARGRRRPSGSAMRCATRTSPPPSRTLAREGAEDFYTGGIARRIAGRHGAPRRAALGGRPRRLPRRRCGRRSRCGYRGRTVAVPPPPAGGIMVARDAPHPGAVRPRRARPQQRPSTCAWWRRR